jgi:hypothetical protein
MSLKSFDGFVSLKTHHCVTGSMRNLYAFNKHDLSEEMLLGLGEGVGFMYWHAKGQLPFMGGRATPKPSMEELAGQCTGVGVQIQHSASAGKARKALLERLEAGQPVMLQVDMGFLPYFDFGGEEYHFGGHMIVVCGCKAQSGTALVADRDGLHPIPMADLEKARGSTFKPFPPGNAWYTFDFGGFHLPTVEAVCLAIAHQADAMLNPPIRNMGVKGIRTAAERIPRWPEQMSAEEIRRTLFNTSIFVSPVGGSGGGLFRFMFNRFLLEAAALTGESGLIERAAEFKRIGEAWDSFAGWAKAVSGTPNPASRLEECTAPLLALADQEQAGWEGLQKLTM